MPRLAPRCSIRRVAGFCVIHEPEDFRLCERWNLLKLGLRRARALNLVCIIEQAIDWHGCQRLTKRCLLLKVNVTQAV